MLTKTSNSYSAPDAYLGGCGGGAKAPRTKLRASWVKPKDEEMSLESLMLKPSKKPIDFMGGSSSKGCSMRDDTEKTANSSVGSLNMSFSQVFGRSAPAPVSAPAPIESAPVEPEERKAISEEEESEPEASEDEESASSVEPTDEFLGGCEPAPVKKWTPTPKEDEDAPAKSMNASWDQPTDFLGGCEPTPIKRWTPPKKEEAPKHMASAYAQDDYLPGCGPKEIKRWTPPKKDDTEASNIVVKSWDQPTDFLGGCEPAPIKKWTRPKEASSSEGRRASWDKPTQFLGGCEPPAVRRWSKPTTN